MIATHRLIDFEQLWPRRSTAGPDSTNIGRSLVEVARRRSDEHIGEIGSRMVVSGTVPTDHRQSLMKMAATSTTTTDGNIDLEEAFQLHVLNLTQDDREGIDLEELLTLLDRLGASGGAAGKLHARVRKQTLPREGVNMLGSIRPNLPQNRPNLARGRPDLFRFRTNEACDRPSSTRVGPESSMNSCPNSPKQWPDIAKFHRL